MSTSRAYLPEPQTAMSTQEIRVLAFTRGRDVPSARFRVQQYRDVLAQHGVRLVEAPARLGAYPPARRALRLPWGAGILAERTYDAGRSWRYDVTLFQREMVATMLTVERLTHSPRVLDVDDAIWMHGGRDFTRRIADMADRIICGNEYLADRFSHWHDRIAVIPTAVDTQRFVPDRTLRQAGLIGWTGSSSGLPYLYAIEPAIEKLFRRHPHARLRVISDAAPRFRHLAAERVEFVPWTRDVEIRAVQQLSVGLMPLRDSEWERGKCSYKMLLYAACGVPSVVSPVGMNAAILGMDAVGYGATTADEWIDALSALLESEADGERMGCAGRRLVLNHFDARHWGGVLGNELRNAIR